MSFNLNEFQKEAVTHIDGPCLVTSCPGSGKTFTLVERIVHLIDSGVPQKNMICLTFTNKAAREMKERVCKRLGIKKEELKLYMGTFHSLGAQFLRKLGPGRGYSSRFTILDDKDQLDTIAQIARHMEYDISSSEVYDIMDKINKYRDQMESEEWLLEQITTEENYKIAKEYLSHCKNNNIVDFSGLISESIRIIEEDEDIKRKVQNTFKYVMVDETQDTNKSQFYMVNLLGGKWKNIMLIGDIDQCIVEGEKVSTPNGDVEIQDIKVGDIIYAASGNGGVSEAKVKNTYKKFSPEQQIVKLVTKKGREIRMSKEHMIFAGYVENSPKKIVVYLMHSEKFGYRIGITNTKRKHGLNISRIGSMLNQERADCMWILKSVDNIDEAKYWEQYYSVEYGIPSWCFYGNHEGRDMDYSDDSVKRLFETINTGDNAIRLMEDLLLFKERPHYVPKCACENKRRNFTINMCADSRNGTLHRYMVSGSDDNDREILIKNGLKVRDAGKGKRGWRVDSSFKSLGDVYDILKKVESCFPVNVIEKAKLGDEALSLIPASHLRPGMAVFVENKGKIECDYVDNVLCYRYNCNLYDLDVERYHNFITNGIVSHNSIYGWRGARYQNILDFLEQYPDCRKISLSKNYRSTPQIVSHAHKLIKYNTSHMGTNFETDNPHGEPVRLFMFDDQHVEADWVGRQIHRLIEDGGWDPQDIAVLYRMNKMSEPIEQSLVSRGISYEVIGARNFYDRREIKDCLSMARFLLNHRDGVAFHRLAKLVANLGNVTIGRIEKKALDQDISILEACRLEANNVRSTKTRLACKKICEIYDRDWDLSNPPLCFSELTKAFDYEDYIEKQFEKDGDERKDNIVQLRDSSGDFSGDDNGMARYMQQVSLVSSSDKESSEGKVSLMSLHAAKGLEFPIVFMIGVEEGILPHQKSINEDDFHGREEERRLCYVGMTRAKKVLYISFCKARKGYNKKGEMYRSKTKVSSFMQEAGLKER